MSDANGAEQKLTTFRIKSLEWEDAGKDRYEACPLLTTEANAVNEIKEGCACL